MTGRVIDFLQDQGLPPPPNGERLIFLLQMENKLAFKHMKGSEQTEVVVTCGEMLKLSLNLKRCVETRRTFVL